MEQKLEELVESDIIEPVEGPIPTLSGPKSGQNLEGEEGGTPPPKIPRCAPPRL